MKSEWNIGTISEVCSLVTDGSHYSPKSCDNGEYMVSVKDFKEFGFDFSNCKHISSSDYEKMKASGCIPECGDILIGKDGARFFEDIIIYNQPEKPALLSSIAILRCNPDIILPQFLYYICKNPVFKKDVRDNYGSGSAIPRIVLKDFKRMPISYPDLDEQRKIVASLVAIDDRILLNTAINENLEQQAQAIFKSWFVDFEPFGGVMPEDMREVPLNELCEIVTKGTTPTTIGKHFSDKGINFLKAESILQNHSFDRNKFAHIDNDTHKVLKRSIIKEGDIVFTIAGTLGRFALVDNTIIPANTNQAVAIIRANKNVISSEYLYSFFIGNWYNEYYAKRVQQAVQANLSLATIKSLPIFVLSNKDMMRYNDLVTPICKAMKANEYENLCLSALRDTLLPKLMNGEIDVSKVKI